MPFASKMAATAGPFRKLIVECIEAGEAVNRPKDTVMTLVREFDFDAYERTDDKKLYLAQFLRDVVTDWFELEGWNSTVVAEAFVSMQAKDFVSRTEINAPVLSPNRKLKAQLRHYYEMEKVRFVAAVENRYSGTIVEVSLVDTEPTEFAYDGYWGELRWSDHQTLTLVPRASSLESVHVTVVDID